MEAHLEAAVRAVRIAAHACREVQRRRVRPDALEKRDRSPVTLADFASQAVVCTLLRERLGGDTVIVAEEVAAALREDAAAGMRDEVARIVGEALGRSVCPADALDAIDAGAGDPPPDGAPFWTLDPIDGTKGFLRGEQYAVALARITHGRPDIGVLGCPNLEHDGAPGALFFAVAGGPVLAMPLDDAAAEPRIVRVATVDDIAHAVVCESVESGHSDQSGTARVARALGIRAAPLRMDSQCKYAAVARGAASIYLRLPTRADYQEKIWDHAAGALLVERAGGTVTDATGAQLDFSMGRTLAHNRGVIATGGGIHDRVVAAVRAALGDPPPT